MGYYAVLVKPQHNAQAFQGLTKLLYQAVGFLLLEISITTNIRQEMSIKFCSFDILFGIK